MAHYTEMQKLAIYFQKDDNNHELFAFAFHL